jgi:hypothetical protein
MKNAITDVCEIPIGSHYAILLNTLQGTLSYTVYESELEWREALIKCIEQIGASRVRGIRAGGTVSGKITVGLTNLP